MGEYIFNEQLQIKYGRLSSILKAAVVVGAVSLRAELPLFFSDIQVNNQNALLKAKTIDGFSTPVFALINKQN